MPKYLVLKLLPQGQRPGEIVELHEDVGRVFLIAEAVRLLDDEPAAPEDPPEAARRRYRRRDLQAER